MPNNNLQQEECEIRQETSCSYFQKYRQFHNTHAKIQDSNYYLKGPFLHQRQNYNNTRFLRKSQSMHTYLGIQPSEQNGAYIQINRHKMTTTCFICISRIIYFCSSTWTTYTHALRAVHLLVTTTSVVFYEEKLHLIAKKHPWFYCCQVLLSRKPRLSHYPLKSSHAIQTSLFQFYVLARSERVQ